MHKKPRPLGTDWFVGPDWPTLLSDYQAAPGSQTSTSLLQALNPGVVWCLESLDPTARVVDAEDLRQQLLLELLEAAVMLPPNTPGEWIPVRLLEQARRKVFRWQRRLSWLETEPIDPSLPADSLLEPGVLDQGAPIAMGGHLYDKAVIGIKYVDQARALGVAAATIRKRASRERKRLQRSLANDHR